MPVINFYNPAVILRKNFCSYYDSLKDEIDKFWDEYITPSELTDGLEKYKSQLLEAVCESALDYLISRKWAPMDIITSTNENDVDYSEHAPDFLVDDVINVALFFPKLALSISKGNYERAEQLITSLKESKLDLENNAKALYKKYERYDQREWSRIPLFQEADKIVKEMPGGQNHSQALRQAIDSNESFKEEFGQIDFNTLKNSYHEFCKDSDDKKEETIGVYKLLKQLGFV